MYSAFGVDHGPIAKGASADAAKVLKEGMKFKPIKPGVKPTGPGSLRGKLDPTTSHWSGKVKKGWKTNTAIGGGVAAAGAGTLLAKPKLAAPLGTAAKKVTSVTKPIGNSFMSGFKPPKIKV